jgi:glucokinase
MSALYLGIEIGGTKLQLGVGAADGKLRSMWRGQIDKERGAEGIRSQIQAAVPELLRQAGLSAHEIKGVGVGFGGPVDDTTATVIRSHQIEGWDGFPLADWVSELTGLPAVLGNDAAVAGLAEAWHGAGKGISPLFYMNIGSGIGGCLVIDGEMYRGCGRGAGEIGQIQFRRKPDYPDSACVTLERLASGWAIEERANLLARLGQRIRTPTPKREGERITAADVARAATGMCSVSIQILYDAWDDLAEAICHVITLLCPRRIVLGGGISLLGEELLFIPLRQNVAERVFQPFAGLTDIVPAALGEEVVVHGAIELARKRLGMGGPT